MITATRQGVAIVACHHCGVPFKYLDAGDGGVSKAHDIRCPHCGKTHSWRVTAGSFTSSVLTAEEEQKYRAENPKPDG